MKLAQFKSYWTDNFSAEEKQTYKILHGEDEENWPDKRIVDFITIDLDSIIRFNPGRADNTTTVELNKCGSYGLIIEYEEFKKILNSLEIIVHDFSEKCHTE